jgi:pyridoxine 5'-phosphate synthase PdxJ
MTRLSVNVNKIATLRNTRQLEVPNLVKLAGCTRCTNPALSGSDGLMHTGGHDSDRAEVG